MTAVAAPGDAGGFRLFASVSRLHIVSIATLGTLTFGWLFTGRYLPIACVACAIDWFVVNLLNRVVDLPEDRANQIVGTDFVARHARGVRALGFGALFGSLGAIHLVAPAMTPWRLGYHCLGLAYNWPIFPGRARIKELYFFKNAASATGFMITCFAYPLAIARGAWTSGVSAWTIALTAAFFFLFELSYEVVYDLRDAEGDRAAALRTYPVVHGEAIAVRIVDALCATSLACLVIGFAMHVVPWRIAVMGVAPILQLVLTKRWLARGITSKDCVRLTWIGAGLLAAYHLWVIAGLPGVDA